MSQAFTRQACPFEQIMHQFKATKATEWSEQHFNRNNKNFIRKSYSNFKKEGNMVYTLIVLLLVVIVLTQRYHAVSIINAIDVSGDVINEVDETDFHVENVLGNRSNCNVGETLYTQSEVRTGFGKSHRFYFTAGQLNDGKIVSRLSKSASSFCR